MLKRIFKKQKKEVKKSLEDSQVKIEATNTQTAKYHKDDTRNVFPTDTWTLILNVVKKESVARNIAQYIGGERRGCPLADVTRPVAQSVKDGCPFHKHRDMVGRLAHAKAKQLQRRGSAFAGNKDSADLLQDIGGGDRIREACTRFYARAFEDGYIFPFMTIEGDGAVSHGKRLGDWIIEKMGGEGRPWTASGRHGKRQMTHYRAWNASARDPAVRGEHFKLDDCRIWMRLHFWAYRECGLAEHPVFWQWYIKFIAHFISIYERRAPRFAPEDAAWSASPANIAKYRRDGNRMIDVIGVDRYSW